MTGPTRIWRSSLRWASTPTASPSNGAAWSQAAGNGTGFDVIAITDHIINSDCVIGRFAGYSNQTVTRGNFDEYMAQVASEAARAWERYRMLVIPGAEITKDYFREKDAAHLLLLGVSRFVSADQPWEAILSQGREQGALIVACHPHRTDHEVIDTLYFWNNREKYAHWFDAWEVANRTDLFAVVSLNNYPIIANSDFHKAKHLYSWKTLLPCEKTLDSVMACIRDNRGVAITLFRNGTSKD